MPYWLEFLYLLTGGPLLAALAAAGLWQLWLARGSLKTSREAIEIAKADIEQRSASERTRLSVDLCIRFAEHVLPLIDDAQEVLSKSPLPEPPAGSNRWSRDSYSEKWNAGWQVKTKTKKVMRALNAMEAVAIPFVNGAADIDVARSSISFAFVRAAFSYSFIVACIKSGLHEDAFPAVRELADRWSDAASDRQAA